MTSILPKTDPIRKLHGLLGRGGVSTLVPFAIVVLVGVGSFGLGRLTALQEQKSRLVIYAPNEASTIATPTPRSENNTPALRGVSEVPHNFVASKNGTKYYPAGCSGASRIKSANEVWFESESSAQASGYTLASGCGGVQ